jgi:hypothetical protein
MEGKAHHATQMEKAVTQPMAYVVCYDSGNSIFRFNEVES